MSLCMGFKLVWGNLRIDYSSPRKVLEVSRLTHEHVSLGQEEEVGGGRKSHGGDVERSCLHSHALRMSWYNTRMRYV